MAGDYGKIDAAGYSENFMTVQRVERLETAVANWLENEKPGTFSSSDAVDMYERANEIFARYSGRRDTRDNFEIALARCGYRAGVVVFNGESRWILVLPASLDTALDRMAALEVRPA